MVDSIVAETGAAQQISMDLSVVWKHDDLRGGYRFVDVRAE